jgi:hypothetical protein
MVLTVYSALSLVIGLSCHHRRQLVLAGLISASRYRDHAASPSAFGAFVFCTARVHRIPHPTFVTIAKRPSLRERDGGESAFDLPDGASQIFLAKYLDRKSGRQTEIY